MNSIVPTPPADDSSNRAANTEWVRMNMLDGGFVSYAVPQPLTPPQQEQARENVGLATATIDNAITRFDGADGATQNSGVTISDANAVGGAASVAISGNTTATTPGGNTAAFLDLTNINMGAQGRGAEIRMGATAGSPYAIIRTSLTSGGTPNLGQLDFYTNDITTGLLTRRLRINQAGGVFSGSLDTIAGEAIGSGGAYNFGALTQTNQTVFNGYAERAVDGGLWTGYFVSSRKGGTSGGCAGVYAEARIYTAGGIADGIECDVQNVSGLNPRRVTPNNIFGVTSDGPVTFSIISQANGTDLTTQPVLSASAWAAVVLSKQTNAQPKYEKGLVFERDAIEVVNGRQEAISFPNNNEIVWWAADNSVGRLTSDGHGLSWIGSDTTGSSTLAPGLNITGTLNTTGIVLGAAIFADITNTASNASSTLVDIKSDGTSRLTLSMTGALTIAGALATASSIRSIINSAEISIGASSDVRWTRAAAATWQMGAANAASPVAQTLQAQGSRVGTDSNVAGGNLTIRPGVGTGNATPSTLILQSYVPVASGSTTQTLATGLTILRGTAVTAAYTVATLPTGVAAGARAHVTDATANSFGAALTGGGSTVAPAFFNGTAWITG